MKEEYELSKNMLVRKKYFKICARMHILEIPALRVFLGADAQLLGTSMKDARMPLSICV